MLRQVIYWRDIPAQVVVSQGRRQQVKRILPEIFAEMIDMAAMKAGLKADDDYLQAWRKGEPEEVEGDMEALADEKLAEIIAAYPKDRLLTLAKQGGIIEN